MLASDDYLAKVILPLTARLLRFVEQARGLIAGPLPASA
jgi:hypothetical protein